MTDHTHTPIIEDPDLPGLGMCYTCALPIKQYVGMNADESFTYRWMTDDEFAKGFEAVRLRIQQEVSNPPLAP
jgi:hypothetical protein